MRKNLVAYGLAVALILSVSLLLACGGPAAAPSSSEGASILEERCTVCHSLDRVEQKQKTHEEWTTTVTRMIGKGAELSESEQATLIDHLTETYGP